MSESSVLVPADVHNPLSYELLPEAEAATYLISNEGDSIDHYRKAFPGLNSTLCSVISASNILVGAMSVLEERAPWLGLTAAPGAAYLYWSAKKMSRQDYSARKKSQLFTERQEWVREYLEVPDIDVVRLEKRNGADARIVLDLQRNLVNYNVNTGVPTGNVKLLRQISTRSEKLGIDSFLVTYDGCVKSAFPSAQPTVAIDWYRDRKEPEMDYQNTMPNPDRQVIEVDRNDLYVLAESMEAALMQEESDSLGKYVERLRNSGKSKIPLVWDQMQAKECSMATFMREVDREFLEANDDVHLTRVRESAVKVQLHPFRVRKGLGVITYSQSSDDWGMREVDQSSVYRFAGVENATDLADRLKELQKEDTSDRTLQLLRLALIAGLESKYIVRQEHAIRPLGQAHSTLYDQLAALRPVKTYDKNTRSTNRTTRRTIGLMLGLAVGAGCVAGYLTAREWDAAFADELRVSSSGQSYTKDLWEKRTLESYVALVHHGLVEAATNMPPGTVDFDFGSSDDDAAETTKLLSSNVSPVGNVSLGSDPREYVKLEAVDMNTEGYWTHSVYNQIHFKTTDNKASVEHVENTSDTERPSYQEYYHDDSRYAGMPHIVASIDFSESNGAISSGIGMKLPIMHDTRLVAAWVEKHGNQGLVYESVTLATDRNNVKRVAVSGNGTAVSGNGTLRYVLVPMAKDDILRSDINPKSASGIDFVSGSTGETTYFSGAQKAAVSLKGDALTATKNKIYKTNPIGFNEARRLKESKTLPEFAQILAGIPKANCNTSTTLFLTAKYALTNDGELSAAGGFLNNGDNVLGKNELHSYTVDRTGEITDATAGRSAAASSVLPFDPLGRGALVTSGIVAGGLALMLRRKNTGAPLSSFSKRSGGGRPHRQLLANAERLHRKNALLHRMASGSGGAVTQIRNFNIKKAGGKLLFGLYGSNDSSYRPATLKKVSSGTALLAQLPPLSVTEAEEIVKRGGNRLGLLQKRALRKIIRASRADRMTSLRWYK